MSQFPLDFFETPNGRKKLIEADIIVAYDPATNFYLHLGWHDRMARCRPLGTGPYQLNQVDILIDSTKPEEIERAKNAVNQAKNETLAAAIDELDNLNETERGELKESLPDMIQETPKTETAIARFKKTIAKVGAIGGKLLIDTLSKVAAEVVVKSMGIK